LHLRKNTHPEMIFLRCAVALNNPLKSGISPLETTLPADVVLHHQTKHKPLKKTAMKTKTIISAISLALVLAAGSLFANRTNDTRPTDRQKTITYAVKINCNANFYIAYCHYAIAITNENGRLVGPAQEFHPGISVYTFKEAGPVTGTRIAVMFAHPASPSGWIPDGWSVPPSIKTGTFIGGETYQFELTPVQNSKGVSKEL
jgi:hypothetical protein